MDERARRSWAGSESITFGRGGIRAVAEVLKVSQQVVIAGSRELKGVSPGRVPPAAGRQRRPGGGRKAKAEQEPGLVKTVEEIVDPATRAIR